MNFQPIAIVVAFLIAGICLQYFGNVYGIWCDFVLLGSLFGCVVFILWKKFSLQYFTHFVVVFFLSLGIFLTHIAGSKPKNYFEKDCKGTVQLIQFSVDEITNTSDYYRKYFVSVHSIIHENKWKKVSGRLLLKIEKNANDSLKYGSVYTAFVAIKPISESYNPVGFQYATFLRNKRIYHQALLDSVTHVDERLRFSWVKNIKTILAKNASQSNYSKESQEVLRAITFGDRSDMSFESMQRFSRSGIIHVLAISGMHVVLIFQVLLWLFNGFTIYSPKKYAIVTSLLVLLLYAFIIGFQPSVVRAVLMLFVYYGFVLLGRVPNVYHSLSLSALLILLYDPLQLFDVGFQLSYTAVFFMVWLYRPFFSLVKVRKKWKKEVIAFLSLTFAAQIGTLPLSLYYFHQYSFLSFFANLVIVPFSGLLIVYSFLCVFQVVLFPECTWFAWLYNVLIDALHLVTRWVSEQHSLLFSSIPFSIWELLLLTLFLVFLRFFVRKRTYKNGLILLAILAVFQLTRLALDVISAQKSEFVVFHQYSYSVLAFKENNQLTYLLSDSVEQYELVYYTLNPYALENRITDYKTYVMTGNTRCNASILYLQKAVNDSLSIREKILVISHSPKINWEKLNLHSVETIVFDSNNYPNYVKKQTDLLRSASYKGTIWNTKSEGAFIQDLTSK